MPPFATYTERLPRALAIGMGLASADPEDAGRVRAAQIDAMVRLTPVAMIASCLNGLIVLLLLRYAGRLGVPMLLWGCALFGAAIYHGRSWIRASRREGPRQASPRALHRAALHGAVFGAIWGAAPILTFAGAPPSLQLVITCLTSGMMCAGGFVLTTVPLAGCAYVAFVLAGASIALAAGEPNIMGLGMGALLWIYAGVIAANLCSNAQLFVEHFLAEARLQAEILARERAQAQLAHAQRMTALGELAGGIAHDFNNILQAITGNASLVARRAEDPEQMRQLAGSILDVTARGGAITRRLLASARQDTLCAEPVDVAAVLNSAAILLAHIVGQEVRLVVDVPQDVPPVLADQAQLEISIVNLATNARDAMPEGGTLTLAARAETIAAHREHIGPAAGAYVRIEVTDTGLGMDQATLARSAELFFTTKPRGKGTGLGLAMTKGFAEQSGGALSIASTPGQGTTVTLWLPQTVALPGTPAATVVREPNARRAAHVLVVDDDAEVRDSLVRCLAEAGFTVTGVGDAEAALRLIDQNLRAEVMITDLTLPGLNGLELARAARARRPELSAILLTGRVGELAGIEPGDVTILQKPIRPSTLAEQVDAALSGHLVANKE